MVHPIYPCLWFNGKTDEAAQFYTSVLPDSQILSSDSVVTMLSLCGKKVMLLNGGPQYAINPSVSFFLLCETKEELDALAERLMVEGSAMIPVGNYPWSEYYGWVKDRFGMTWQLMLDDSAGQKDKLRPCLLFTGAQFGKAAEAMTLYTGLFDQSSVTESILYPEGTEFAGTTQYAEFELNGYPLIAMDGPGEHAYGFDYGVSFVVNCDTQEEIDHYWDTLTRNGEESMCGWLSDSYGVSWQIIPTALPELMSDPAKRDKVVAAFLKMRKFIIADLLVD